MPAADRKRKQPLDLASVAVSAPPAADPSANTRGAGARSEEPAAASLIPIASLALSPGRKSASAADAAVAGPTVLFPKGAATALTFRPSYWSFDANSGRGNLRPEASPEPVAPTEAGLMTSSTPSETERSDAAEVLPPSQEARDPAEAAAQQALASSLAEIIENVLSTHEFVAILVYKTRFRVRDLLPRATLSEEDSTAPAPASLDAFRAELASANPRPEAPARATESWVDRALGLFGAAMVAAAAFFAINLWQGSAPPGAIAAPSQSISVSGASLVAPESK